MCMCNTVIVVTAADLAITLVNRKNESELKNLFWGKFGALT